MGAVGTIIGALATISGQWVKHHLETKEKSARDNSRRKLLATMLNNPGPNGWRKMETLSRVIGADKDDTARLLVDIGARGCELGNEVWAWIKDKPLPGGD
jgi:hypothetical protein